jgi:hypothetical protein
MRLTRLKSEVFLKRNLRFTLLTFEEYGSQPQQPVHPGVD